MYRGGLSVDREYSGSSVNGPGRQSAVLPRKMYGSRGPRLHADERSTPYPSSTSVTRKT